MDIRQASCDIQNEMLACRAFDAVLAALNGVDPRRRAHFMAMRGGLLCDKNLVRAGGPGEARNRRAQAGSLASRVAMWKAAVTFMEQPRTGPTIMPEKMRRARAFSAPSAFSSESFVVTV